MHNCNPGILLAPKLAIFERGSCSFNVQLLRRVPKFVLQLARVLQSARSAIRGLTNCNFSINSRDDTRGMIN